MDPVLFNSSRGQVGKSEILETLKACGSADCDALYVHTDMVFEPPALKKNQLLSEILGIFESLGVKTVIFPTLTFSFCNNEDFNVQKSKTPMSAINEFVRKSGHGVRTHDSLPSVYVLGKPLNLLDPPGKYFFGLDSTYDRLHKSAKEIKFLFFGAHMWDCFTYIHYVEAGVGVPYRYDRLFSGNIISGGIVTPDRFWLYSTYANCRLSPKPVVYDYKRQKGMLGEKPLGDATLCCLREQEAWDSITWLLDKDIYCLTDSTFYESFKDDTYNPKWERIVSVR